MIMKNFWIVSLFAAFLISCDSKDEKTVEKDVNAIGITGISQGFPDLKCLFKVSGLIGLKTVVQGIGVRSLIC